MKQIVDLLREKSQLQYHINAIREYINDKNYDMRLKEVWDSYNKDLEAVDAKLDELSMPALEEFEQEKLRLLGEIKEHEDALEKCREQIKELQRLTKLINKA
ncbi:MAG: hypothetical protein JXN65_07850 [Clostridia bacterium]|nr:hypothetical protein [Clostridia bacterium]